MICFPNAKINIGLHVLAKREDGFHSIESVLVPIGLSEVLEILPQYHTRKKCIIHQSGMKMEGDDRDNLVVRAYELLNQKMDLPPVEIYLHKAIPMGSGLGGGSADGAFALIQLNRLFQLGLTRIQLEGYAAILGSDCPFFIQNNPAIVTGRGDIMEPTAFQDSGTYSITVVNPNIHVDTKKAYAHVILNSKKEGAIRDIVKLHVKDWAMVLSNDFEPYVLGEFPAVKEIKDVLYSQGALYASMTGSGSSVYGIFEEDLNLNNIFPNYFCWTGVLNLSNYLKE